MARVAIVVALVLALTAPAAQARTLKVRWEQDALVAYRVWDEVGFTPIKGIQPNIFKRRTVKVGATTYKVLWTNNTINRGSTAIALREAHRDATHVPKSYLAVYTDRPLTSAQRKRFDVKLDLGRDADVLVVNRDNPVCASGLTLAQARGIARGTISRWSQVTALPAGQPDEIARHVRGTDRYAQPRFGVPPVPKHAVVELDGGVSAAYYDRAVAAVTSWSRVRAYTSSVCAVAIDGVTPTDANVFTRSYGPAYPIEVVLPHHRRTDPQGRAMVAAYVAFLRSPTAAAQFRKAGVLLTADGVPAAAARYHNFDCIFRHGPEYRWATGAGEHWRSSTYLLRGFGTSCRFAKRWVRRLAKQPYNGGKKPRRHSPALHHGPAGWHCESQFVSPQLEPHTAYQGVCQNTKDLRRVFSWEPQSGYDDGPVDPPPTPTPEPEPTVEPGV